MKAMRIIRIPPPLRSMLLAWALLGIVASTAHGSDQSPPLPVADFRHDVTEGPQPWTPKPFDAHDDRFMFAVFADLTGGERPRVFEIAIAQLNLLRPELIIGVGDLIEGETGDRAELDREWDHFDARALSARAPVFYVGGNHDLAGVTMQDTWNRRYGPRYYHFVYKDVLFLVLDTEDHTPERTREIERLRAEALERVKADGWAAMAETEYIRIPEYAAGTISAAQSGYFRAAITANADVRWTFLNLDDDGVDIANLLLSGILDRTGHVPRGGDEVCFEAARCGEAD